MFRLRPTARQHAALAACVEAHRELYNAALQERRDGWSHASKKRIRYGDQSAQLTAMRAARSDQAVWSFSSQQATLRRLNKAFDGFFRRIKTAKPSVRLGYPRFQGTTRFDSVEWPKDGDGARWLPDQRRVYLQGIGQVKVHQHRAVAGRVKTIQIKRKGRRWMVVLSCDDVPTNPLPVTGRQAGIDVGIVSFATTSDGEHVDNPRWARASAARLAAAQQRLQRASRGGNNRAAKRETVAARHRKIANRRKDFHHKQARRLVARYDLIVMEDLKIANMLRRANSHLSKLRFDHLAARVAGQRVDKPHRTWGFEIRQVLTGVRDHRLFVEPGIGPRHQEGSAHLAESLVGHADHRAVHHTVQAGQHLLDLGGVDIEAAADVHVLEPVGDLEIACGIELSDVTGVQPTVAVDRQPRWRPGRRGSRASRWARGGAPRRSHRRCAGRNRRSAARRWWLR